MTEGHEHATYILGAQHGRSGRDSGSRATRGRGSGGYSLDITCATRLAG